MSSPVGKIKLVASDKGLIAILWENDRPRRVPIKECVEQPEHPLLQETVLQLNEYFEGQRKIFSIPLDFRGTDFQKKVWEALLAIPYGETRTYREQAILLGNIKAVRAVGAANGKNPISIIVPCHRVIGASGSLTGFAGGIENKAFLLNLENQHSGHKNKKWNPAHNNVAQGSIF